MWHFFLTIPRWYFTFLHQTTNAVWPECRRRTAREDQLPWRHSGAPPSCASGPRTSAASDETQTTRTTNTRHVTMMWGAEKRTAMVAITVNRVKMNRHRRSTTMAANFQSFVISSASSVLRSLSVMWCSSLRIKVSSRCGPRQPAPAAAAAAWWSSVPPPAPPSSACRRYPAPGTPDDMGCPGSVPWCRKSSSISNTFANRLLEERSLSSKLWGDFLEPGEPPAGVSSGKGLDILRMQGNHCRNRQRTHGDISCVSALRWW